MNYTFSLTPVEAAFVGAAVVALGLLYWRLGRGARRIRRQLEKGTDR